MIYVLVIKRLFMVKLIWNFFNANCSLKIITYYTGTDPLFAEEAKGSKIYDDEGRRYVDYVLSFGANMLGHAHKEVVRTAQSAIKDGASYGITTRYEVELAGIIKKATGA